MQDGAVTAAVVTMGVTPAVAVLLVLDGHGRTRGGRMIPRAGRDWLGLLIVAVATVPVCLLLVPWGGAIAAAVVAAWAVRALVGPHAALAIVGALTASLVVVDQALGAPLLEASPYALGAGGVDETLAGLTLGAALVAVAGGLDAARERPWVRAVGAAGLAGVLVVLAAPALGDSSAIVGLGVPAVVTFALLGGGRRLDGRHALLVVAVTAAVAASLAAAGQTRGVTGASMRAVSSASAVTVVIALFATLAGPIRAREAWERATFGRPMVRAVVWASVVGSIAVIALERGGSLAAAGTMCWSGCAAVLATLVRDRP